MVNESAIVSHVHCSRSHSFSKRSVGRVRIIAGFGVEGDAHAGDRVQHLSRVYADPAQPNLRQVHLIHAELLEELGKKGFEVAPGKLGENITTRGIDLLALGRNTLLHIGDSAVFKVTGLRNPCAQIEAFAPGLLKEVAVKTPIGLVRKAGIMCVALTSGEVEPGKAIRIEAPEGPHIPLNRV